MFYSLPRPSGKREDTLRSTLQRDNSQLFGGCLPRQLLPSCAVGLACTGVLNDPNFVTRPDFRRQPITALATQGFWNGVSDLKDVLSTPKNPLLLERNETAKFYVNETTLRSSSRNERLLAKLQDEEIGDNFFEDIGSLYRRQSMLFQRCCQQLKDIYQTESENMMNGKDAVSYTHLTLPTNREV